jgi:hypothetical protein
MIYSSVAEERHHALQLGRALNSRPVSGKTCRMMVTRECRLATLLTQKRSFSHLHFDPKPDPQSGH